MKVLEILMMFFSLVAERGAVIPLKLFKHHKMKLLVAASTILGVVGEAKICYVVGETGVWPRGPEDDFIGLELACGLQRATSSFIMCSGRKATNIHHHHHRHHTQRMTMGLP